MRRGSPPVRDRLPILATIESGDGSRVTYGESNDPSNRHMQWEKHIQIDALMAEAPQRLHGGPGPMPWSFDVGVCQDP